MSSYHVEATNPNFSYAGPEHQDKKVGAQGSSADNGNGERAIVPRMPVHIVQTQRPSAPAQNNSLIPANEAPQAAFVADVQLEREAKLGQVHIATAQVGDVNIIAAKAANLMVEEKIHQRHELVQTDQGLHYRQVTLVERRVYAEIVEALYVEASKENPKQLAIEEGGDPAVSATCGEKCTDFCCQACVCNFQSPFARQNEKPFMEKKDILTPILRRGRAKGWGIYSKFAFPLVRDTIRNVWVIAEFLTILAALLLSILSFVKGNREIFNSLHLAIIILSTVLALLDTAFLLKDLVCKSSKACKYCVQNKSTGDSHDTTAETCQCKKCLKGCKNISDFLRVLFTELLLYPLLICDLFEFIIGDGYEGEKVEDRISFALFILSLLALVLYVYFARILILIGMIYNVHKQRQPFVQETVVRQRYSYDGTIAKGALYFQGFFFIHVLGQMIAQLMMLVAIGAKIEHNNKEVNLDCKPWQTVCVSPTLWYMIVAGYIMSICGFSL